MNEKPIIIQHDQNPKGSVIWLHGLGADGHDFVPVVEMLELPQLRFILPHAPHQPVTINNGYEMRAWYDIYGLAIGSREDAEGIKQTQNHIEGIINAELESSIPSQKIVLAGFSQGGAIALHTALRFHQPLAGVIALSTYLPLKSAFSDEKSMANQKTPIFMAHGTQDEVIDINTCHLSHAALKSENYNVALHEYPIAHSVSIDEIDEIRTFLLNIIE